MNSSDSSPSLRRADRPRRLDRRELLRGLAGSAGALAALSVIPVPAAAALPELPYACGLATSSLLAGDVVHSPLLADRGEIPLRRPTPDPELLERWHPAEEVASGMISRLQRVAVLLRRL